MTKEQIKEFTLRTSQANQSGLILVLTDIAVCHMKDSLNSYAAQDADAYAHSVELARRSVNELCASFAPADPLGTRVIAILRFIYGKLNKSAIRGVPDELDRCVTMLDNLKVGFEHLHELDREGPVMKNTHQVYAGLTYGKGVLNESVSGVDVSTRGFKA